MGMGRMAQSRRNGRFPAWLGPTALLALSGFFVGVVFWGVFNPEEIRVEYVDAGAVSEFEIGRMTVIPERDLYVVGMPDGRLRAIDGRVQASGCSVRWLPNDDRGRAANSGGAPGVFEDPCSGAIWSMEANAIQGANEPLRTPFIDYRPVAGSAELHAFVEHVNP